MDIKKKDFQKENFKNTNVPCSSTKIHLNLVDEAFVAPDQSHTTKEEISGQLVKIYKQESEAAKLLKVLLKSNCSFRSFADIISALRQEKLYSGKYAPSYGTYMNWVMRAGISKLNRFQKENTEQSIDIIDHWIGKGSLKLFAVLRISKSDFEKTVNNKNAINLKQLKLIHIEVVEGSNGDKVYSSLKDLYKKSCSPVAIVSDNGPDLKKGIRLLNNDSESPEIYHIEDISHKFACILKKEYGQKEWFQNFLNILGKASKKLCNSKYSHMKAPKQGIKARFMNVNKQVKWCISMLGILNEGKFKNDEEKVFIEAYGELDSNKKEIKKLHDTILIFHKIMKELKTTGLNNNTYKKCTEFLEEIENKEIHRLILEWLENHYLIYEKLDMKGWSSMPISSDPIESFFSKFKQIQKRAPQGDPTRMIAMLPLFVGDDTVSEIHNYLKTTTHSEAKQWTKENVPETIHSKKRKNYQKRKTENWSKTGSEVNQTERPYERALTA